MLDLEKLKFRKLDKNEVKTLVNWAKEEGWNPGKYDFEVFWSTDPDGFYGFHFSDKLIAAGAVISYHGEFGFMGLFIVHPDYRGQGIGSKLWYLRRDILLKRLKEGASIGMDGVVDMQPFYQKGGFKIAFRDERYECIGKDAEIDQNVSQYSSDDFNEILEYDTKCFGFERSDFLSNWLEIPTSETFKYIHEGEILGYATIRKVDSGFKIGPLFANDEKIAEELYKACLKHAIGQPVYLDIPTVNRGAVELVKKYQATYVFECARMYYGKIPQTPVDKVYGITTFELG
ncbi:MAG: GNAT family N-acetyltransferase [Bacteroidota bacterium]